MNTTNLKWLLPLGGVIASGAVTTTTAKTASKKQNVLLILADDFGWNDLGCMGSDYYETPNLDRLAKMGVLFTNGYAGCSVSSPSRASIMTGKTPSRHGITTWIGDPEGEAWRAKNRHTKLLPARYSWALDHREQTIAERLRDEGYTTFMAGKWHMGDTGSSPEDHGFMINKGGWEAGSPKGGYFAPYNNPKLEDGEDGENLSTRLAQETISFIDSQEDSDKPFFAYLAFYAVHGSIETTEEKWEHFRDKANKQGVAEQGFEIDRTQPVRLHQDNPVYAGLVAQMDESIGMVLDHIEELGLDENTMIIFTSDNGGVVSGDSYSTSLAPLRGGKGRQWEGGTRVPYMIYTPNCKANSSSDTPVIGMDIYPTILEYANLPFAPEQHIDGVSIMPLVKQQGEIAPRNLYWHYPHYGNQGGEPASYMRSGDWKLIYYYEDMRYELYNLAMDISESETLNHLYPEKLKELKGELSAWIQETNAVAPQADPEYDPKEESKVELNWRTKLLGNLERNRKAMLSPSWQPNKTWWGSQPIIND